jgi:hypothetical protein
MQYPPVAERASARHRPGPANCAVLAAGREPAQRCVCDEDYLAARSEARAKRLPARIAQTPAGSVTAGKNEEQGEEECCSDS